MRKPILAIAAATVLTLSACGGGESAYDGYKSAYDKMIAGGGIDTNIVMDLDSSGSTTSASGNLKMTSDGGMYFEAEGNGNKIVQFVKDGTLYQDINGTKSSFSTSGGGGAKDQSQQKPSTPEGEVPAANTAFNIDAFMSEFAMNLEASKIKEMGLLDPIPESALSNVSSASEGSSTVYTLTVPDSFVESLFNSMIEDYATGDAAQLSFSNLKDFKCTMRANDSGVLDQMNYSGSTDIKVPAELNNGSEETVNMSVALTLDINNPGAAVEIPDMDTTGY